ncbi:MAG: class I SAM-dependent rRNA methyltransferase [Chitinophagales bacterium]
MQFNHPLPEIQTQRLATKLRPAAERMVKKEHPWVYDQGILKIKEGGKPGDLSIIFDTKTNKFLALGLYDPSSPIRLKLIQHYEAAQIDEVFFAQKIRYAKQQRKALLKTDTNSYRLLFGENDGMPGFICDVYDKVAVVKLYSEIWLPYLKMILPHVIEQSACETMVIRFSRNLQNKNLYGLKEGMVIYGELENDVVIFREHSVRFSANVIHGHKTGYFLDHRENRRRVGEMAKGKRVLDVFSYAGGFSVHALAGGAKEVMSVDISAQALEVAKENAALNLHKGKHITRDVDAFRGMEQLIDNGEKFDVVVIDPPSFAKQASEVQKALYSYEKLAKAGAHLVARGGVLLLASCSSRIVAKEFFELSESTLRNTGKSFRILAKTYHDADHPISFPEGAYLKSGYYQF